MSRSTLAVAVLMLNVLTACSEDDPTPPDVTAPASVDDLRVESASQDSITFGWTASGDDGRQGQAVRYELRYGREPLVEATWDSAQQVPIAVVPKLSGRSEALTIAGVPAASWYFGLRVADEASNWSALSNVVNVLVEGDRPPDPITDLEVVAESSSRVTLRWTATGDDGSAGTAMGYELRHSLSSITEATWDSAHEVTGVPAPHPAGSVETFAVEGLERDQTYFFAVRVFDELAQTSALSNVVHARTQHRMRLTSSSRRSGAFAPHWSPDGKAIAFGADWVQLYQSHLYLISAEGGAPVRLTRNSQNGMQPRWSPDGRQIAFQALRDDGSSSLRELWVMPAKPLGVATRLATHADMPVLGHAWSPDGDYLAYTVQVGTEPLASRIYRVASTGGEPVVLVDYPGYLWTLDWSPDGSRIAFMAGTYDDTDVLVIPASGGEVVELAPHPAIDISPAWSPDGRWVAFSSRRSGNLDIWIVSADGGEPTQLTFDTADEDWPAWSPDGSKIATSSFSEGIGDIWVYAVE